MPICVAAGEAWPSEGQPTLGRLPSSSLGQSVGRAVPKLLS